MTRNQPGPGVSDIHPLARYGKGVARIIPINCYPRMNPHNMTDQELFDRILTYIYKTGGCDDIGVMMKEEYGVILESDRMHRLRRMLVTSGYVEEDNYAYGNHPHLSITDAGTRYMMEKTAAESVPADTSESKGLQRFFRENWKWLVEIIVAVVAALAAVVSC